MTSYSRYKEITLEPYTSNFPREPEETVCLSGRTILLTQIPHVKADISAARGILEKLMADRVTVADDSDRNEVASIAPVSYKGGTI